MGAVDSAFRDLDRDLSGPGRCRQRLFELFTTCFELFYDELFCRTIYNLFELFTLSTAHNLYLFAICALSTA